MMDISIEDMKACIDDWYAQARNNEELLEIHYAVMSECNKQAVYMTRDISKKVLTMAKEYIEREYAVDAVLDVYCDTSDINLSCEKFEAAILKIPTADVAPVRHGQWILLDECSNDGVYCSVCRKKVYRTEHANQKLKSKYCPNCGARMDGEQKEGAE